MSTQIASIHARQVLDSRGWPTVEAEVVLRGGARGRAIAPAGASTGSAEAHELRDGDPDQHDGRGVRRAVDNVRNVIGPALMGFDAAEQARLDARLIELDGAPQKTRLGGNALLAVSLAAAHAAAAARGLELYKHLGQLIDSAPGREGEAPAEPLDGQQGPALGNRGAPGAANTESPEARSARPEPRDTAAGGPPSALRSPRKKLRPRWWPEGETPPDSPQLPLPMTNMISGGLHAGGNLDFQDFLAIPLAAPDYPTALEWLTRIYRRLGALLTEAGYEGRLVGDEGGYGPRLNGAAEACRFVIRAIEAAGLNPGDDVAITLDVAASHFYWAGKYNLSGSEHPLAPSQVIDMVAELCDRFPIVSVEDPLFEEDWPAWSQLTARLGERIQIVGDDLLATNPGRLQTAQRHGAINAALIKMNQVGTLTETLLVMQMARQAGYALVVSARSGETEDTTMADLAVAAAAEQIKIGAIVRGERLAKYNRLLRIGERL